MTKQLREALAAARARLDHDSDAHADVALVSMLVEAIDAAGLGGADTASLLLLTARTAAARAAELAADASSADSASKWSLVAETALKGYRLAPVELPEGDDDERAEMARMIRGYREALAGHEALLVDMAQTFWSAGTTTATRIAGRIEKHLAGYGVQVPEPGGETTDGPREP